MRIAGKDSDADRSFTAIGAVGAISNPSSPGVYITTRGMLTCSALPGWFKYEDLTVEPVWTPYPAGVTREIHVTDTIDVRGPIVYTVTHSATVPAVLGPFSFGTLSHSTTVYTSGE